MKKSIVKGMSLTLCAVLALGGLGGTVYAMNTAGTPAPEQSVPAEPGAEAVPAGDRNVKDETVYVLARADGSVEKIIVSAVDNLKIPNKQALSYPDPCNCRRSWLVEEMSLTKLLQS